MIRRRAVTLIALSWLGSLGLAYGNWTASGTFRYTHREFDQTVSPARNLRFRSGMLTWRSGTPKLREARPSSRRPPPTPTETSASLFRTTRPAPFTFGR